VEKIYAAKIRSRDKAIPLLLAASDDVSLVAESVPPVAHLLAERFWPGGLTLVLRKQAIVSDVVSPGLTVAVRVPMPYLLYQTRVLAPSLSYLGNA
jgi:L-threonylcarbamoyladenylate synthase